MSSQPRMAGSTPPAPSASCNATGAGLSDHLQHVIHDEVLQSLGISMLQAELCRRLWENGQPTEAFDELKGVVREIEAAVEVLRHVMRDLHQASTKQSRSA
jgi:histidine kinase